MHRVKKIMLEILQCSIHMYNFEIDITRFYIQTRSHVHDLYCLVGYRGRKIRHIHTYVHT